MSSILNLGNRLIQTWHSLHNEPHPELRKATDLFKSIASVALKALAIFSTIFALTYIGLSHDIEKVNDLFKIYFGGLICGTGMFTGACLMLLMKVAKVAYLKFHYISSLVSYPPKVRSDFLYSDIIYKIVLNLGFKDLRAFSQVSKGCHGMVSNVNEQRKADVKEITFGKNEWFIYFNLIVKVEPTLPHNIIKILNEPCPIDPTKKVRDTYILTLIPRDLSLKRFQNFSENLNLPFYFNANVEELSKEFLEISNEKSYWALMKKDMIGRNQTFKEIGEGLVKISQENSIYYTLTTALEAAAFSAHQTLLGEIFNKNSEIILCQEKVNNHRVSVDIFHGTSNNNIAFVDADMNLHKGNNIGACGVLRFQPAKAS